MKRLSNGRLAFLLIAIVIAVDQTVKVWVKTQFYYGECYDVTSWFKILFIENNGMAFGMELGSKLLLTWFRIIAVALFVYYLFKIRHRTDLARGYVTCVALITAGAAGNAIDCIAYGLLFDSPFPPAVAQFLPPDGGYASMFNGRVVDMFYFPLFEWDWPSWMPWVANQHFVFFQPIFNVADAALSVSVIVLLLFYTKYLSTEQSEAQPDSPQDTQAEDMP